MKTYDNELKILDAKIKELAKKFNMTYEEVCQVALDRIKEREARIK